MFVANEDLDVRRRILPLMNLNVADHPSEDHSLVTEAIAIARSHPGAYIRHRVEHQV